MRAKILVIAPNEQIKKLYEEAKNDFPELLLDIRVSNLANAIALVRNVEINYDVIIARGETAQMISRVTSIPLIKIQFMAFDVLSAIRQAESLHMPFAMIGYYPMIKHAIRINEMLNYDLDIFTIQDDEDMELKMREIKAKGYSIVVCGMGADHIARCIGMIPIVVTTSMEAVADSLNQTMIISRSVVRSKREIEFYKSILMECEYRVLVYNSHKELVFNSFDKDAAYPISICEKLLQHPSGTQIVEKIHNGMMYVIRQRQNDVNGEIYSVFSFLLKSMPYIPQRNEIRVFSKDDVYDAFLMHFPQFSGNAGAKIGVDIQVVAKANSPVLLIGENGTGKEQIAALLFVNGSYADKPYYVIDAETIGDKGWNTLMYGDDSLLVESGYTIYIKNLDRVSPARLNNLKTIIIDSGLENRLKLIFSCTVIPGAKLPNQIRTFQNELGALSIQLKPLRQRSSIEIQTLIAMYINTIDDRYGKSVIGLSPEAEKMMLDYQWPDNLQQLRRVISDLVINTDTSYIQAELVKKVLYDERSNLTSSFALSSVLDINKRMSEIEKDVARAVLLMTNGNRSQAAAKLGISRTTLWRLLS